MVSEPEREFLSDSSRSQVANSSSAGPILFFGVLLLACYVVMIWFPVHYIQIVGEDKLAEFSTSVTCGIAFVCFGLSALRQKGSRRFFAITLALCCFFIAGEEISWGQRILDVETPEVWKDINVQNEITLHNLHWIQKFGYQKLIVGAGLLTVSLLSAVQSKHPALSTHFPLPGPSLWPVIFVTGILLPLGSDVPVLVKADEVSEMLLGFAMLMWACDLFVKSFGIESQRSFVTAAVAFAVLLSIALVLLAGRTTKGSAWRYKMLALRDYPAYGLLDQSNQIIEFMIENGIADEDVRRVKETRTNESP